MINLETLALTFNILLTSLVRLDSNSADPCQTAEVITSRTAKELYHLVGALIIETKLQGVLSKNQVQNAFYQEARKIQNLPVSMELYVEYQLLKYWD